MFSHVSGALWSMLRLAVEHKQSETSSTELVEAESTKKWRALGDNFGALGLGAGPKSIQGVFLTLTSGAPATGDALLLHQEIWNLLMDWRAVTDVDFLAGVWDVEVLNHGKRRRIPFSIVGDSALLQGCF